MSNWVICRTCKALAAALASKSSANDVITLIEMRFAAAPACGHCKFEDIRAWAKGQPVRR